MFKYKKNLSKKSLFQMLYFTYVDKREITSKIYAELQ